ncbi:MAG: hypothetical protein AAFU73_23460 [Planctomycetota bacterium]
MTTPAIAITPRQLEVLEFIHSTRLARGVSPTLAEVGAYLGVHRTTARDHVHALRLAGAIDSTDNGSPRAIFVTERGRAHLAQLGRTA